MNKKVKFILGFVTGFIGTTLILSHWDDIKRFFAGEDDSDSADFEDDSKEKLNKFEPDPDWKMNENLKKHYRDIAYNYRSPIAREFDTDEENDEESNVSRDEKTDRSRKIAIDNSDSDELRNTIINKDSIVEDSLYKVVDAETLNPLNKENYEILTSNKNDEEIVRLTLDMMTSGKYKENDYRVSYLIFDTELGQWLEKDPSSDMSRSVRPEYVITCIGQDNFIKFLESRSSTIVYNNLFDSIYVVMNTGISVT